MEFFCETQIFETVPNTKAEAIAAGIQEVRIAWCNAHNWTPVAMLPDGEISLLTENPFTGMHWEKRKIIGRAHRYFTGRVIGKRNVPSVSVHGTYIDVVEKGEEVQYPTIGTITQGGFVWA